MFEKNETNSFFDEPYTSGQIATRIKEVLEGKVGFYSVGLYPASLAYNCVMHDKGLNILLAPRNGRELFGAFAKKLISLSLSPGWYMLLNLSWNSTPHAARPGK